MTTPETKPAAKAAAKPAAKRDPNAPKRKYTRRQPAQAPQAPATPADHAVDQANTKAALARAGIHVITATPEFRSDVRQAAFVLETVAHMQGMTAEFLPIVARLRAAIA